MQNSKLHSAAIESWARFLNNFLSFASRGQLQKGQSVGRQPEVGTLLGSEGPAKAGRVRVPESKEDGRSANCVGQEGSETARRADVPGGGSWGLGARPRPGQRSPYRAMPPDITRPTKGRGWWEEEPQQKSENKEQGKLPMTNRQKSKRDTRTQWPSKERTDWPKARPSDVDQTLLRTFKTAWKQVERWKPDYKKTQKRSKLVVKIQKAAGNNSCKSSRERWGGEGRGMTETIMFAKLNTECISGKTGRWLCSEAEGLGRPQALISAIWLRIWVETGGPLNVLALGSRCLEWAPRRVELGMLPPGSRASYPVL